jgi:hypothetical protein
VDLATFWPQPSSPVPAPAFLLYRNYDGKHSSFGDTSVSSGSTNQGKLAVFAAQRGDDGALTIVVVNKTTKAVTSPLELDGFAPAARARVYRYEGKGIETLGKRKVAAGGFTATYPARSATLFEIAPRARS